MGRGFRTAKQWQQLRQTGSRWSKDIDRRTVCLVYLPPPASAACVCPWALSANCCRGFLLVSRDVINASMAATGCALKGKVTTHTHTHTHSLGLSAFIGRRCQRFPTPSLPCVCAGKMLHLIYDTLFCALAKVFHISVGPFLVWHLDSLANLHL